MVPKKMKTQLLMAIAILTSNFALPPLAFAQEKTATPAVPNPFQPIPAGPSLVQQLEAINEQFDEAFNKHDATAVAAFYTANAILSSPLAVASGCPISRNISQICFSVSVLPIDLQK